MKYEKALGKVVEFDNTDIMTASGYSGYCVLRRNGKGIICIGDIIGLLSEDEGYVVESQPELEVQVETPIVEESTTIE